MRINCLGCGHMLDLGESYENYCGPVKCNICRTLISIETERGKLKSMKLENP